MHARKKMRLMFFIFISQKHFVEKNKIYNACEEK